MNPKKQQWNPILKTQILKKNKLNLFKKIASLVVACLVIAFCFIELRPMIGLNQFRKPQLNQVTGVSFMEQANSLSWNKVKHANMYNVYINGNKIQVETNYYAFTSDDQHLEMKVQALDTTKAYKASIWSETIEYTFSDASSSDEIEENRNKSLGITPVINAETQTLTYGIYPQTLVNDEVIIASLNLLTTTEANGGYLYNDEYYTKLNVKPYDENYTLSDGTLIAEGVDYWFKCEPIEWKILEVNDGAFSLVSNRLLDVQRYNEKFSGIRADHGYAYANNYCKSEIRSWLRNDFYKSAFYLGESFIKKVYVDHSVKSTDSSENPFVCDSLMEEVYLLSFADYDNKEYFEYQSKRKCIPTDYALIKGCEYYFSTDKFDKYRYFTRSPSSSSSCWVSNIKTDGTLSHIGGWVDEPINIRPGITLATTMQ